MSKTTKVSYRYRLHVPKETEAAYLAWEFRGQAPGASLKGAASLRTSQRMPKVDSYGNLIFRRRADAVEFLQVVILGASAATAGKFAAPFVETIHA